MELSRLATIPLFADLPEAELAAVAATATEASADEGESLASEGDFGHALYAIETGTATVSEGGALVRMLDRGTCSARSRSSPRDAAQRRSSRPPRCA